MSKRIVKCFLIVVCMQICFAAAAQISYKVNVCDSLTGLTIAPEKVNLFVFKENTNESATLSRGTMYSSDGYNNTIIYRTFTLPHRNEVYDMTIDAEGYIPRSMKLTASTKETDVDLGKIKLERIPKQLDEISVVATKIKVFFDGDTMIYNADAFILPEGSMLDALVKQLPGVELKSDGQIFHNGKKVESLLLNGRKLFDNDPSIMLNNLAAYTVKNIKVYEKDSESASLLGYSDDKEYVMDVNLKKQYMGATSVLAEGGYGTENRYLGRLFATTFTSTSAVAAYFNANNLSTQRLPWSNTDVWNTGQISRTGVASYIGGGMNYSLNSSKRQESLRGNIEVTRTTTDARSGSQGILFLPEGDNVSTSSSRNWNRALKLNTSHRYMRQFNIWQLSINANFDYGNSRTKSNSDSEVSRATDHNLVNRSLRTASSLSHNLKGGLNMNALVRLPDLGETKQNLSVYASGDYTRSHGRFDSFYRIDYGSDPDEIQSEQARRQAYPAYKVYSGGNLRYSLRFPRNYSLSVGVIHDHVWDRNTDFRFLLPEYALDPTNSSKSKQNDGKSKIYLDAGARWGYPSMADGGKGQLEIKISPSITFLNRSYEFMRPEADALNPIRKETFLSLNNFTLDYKLTPHGRNKLSISLKASSIVRPLDMAYLIDVVTDADPLNIHRGNPNLSNPRNNSIELKPSFELITPAYNLMNYLTIRYTTIDNDIVNGWVYNPETGVRRHSQYNVDGTRHFNIGLFSWFYGDSWDIRWSNEYANKRNADMVGTSTADSDSFTPMQEFVYNNSYTGSLKASYNPWKWLELSPEVNSNVSHFKSRGEDFIPFTAIDMTYKMGLQFKMPHNLSLTTDLALNTRRGYADAHLNTNEWILNAGAQWHWTRPGLRFILDGYDLLHQISRISYVINAQGRTESWDNTIPRYVMLRIIYQFNASK
ncbi:MAG: outer membrane beta-barrel family protein [Muribaculaceae bacterium]|nr:outer membrane beta-barrel family protein [Muribaculaceae bacterium]